MHAARSLNGLKLANWRGKWRHLPSVTLAEAVALSLGYEPAQPSLMNLTEYRDRLEMAARCLYESHRFPGTDFCQSPIDLTDFAAWAKSVGWDIQQMDELVQAASQENADQVTLHNREIARRCRSDRLNTTIKDIVNRQPTISEKSVLAKLKKLDWITITASDQIEWVDEAGNKKIASVSGLKDRVTRARPR